MLLTEITKVVTVDSLFEQIQREFIRDMSILSEVTYNSDGSIAWEPPTPAEKAQASNIVQRHQAGPSSQEIRQKQLLDATPVPGDFVFFPDTKTSGIIMKLDQNTGVVDVMNKDRKPMGSFNIRDMKMTGRSNTPYKTVYGMFRNSIVRPIAPPTPWLNDLLLVGV